MTREPSANQAGDLRAVQLLGVAFRAERRETIEQHRTRYSSGARKLFHAAAHLLAPYGACWEKRL